MQITIITLTGKQYPIECEKSDHVIDLKEKIKHKENIPIDLQRLIFAGKQLEDSRILDNYNIKNGSIVYSVLRLS